jgi:3-methyladenine DNA glycosylase Tag
LAAIKRKFTLHSLNDAGITRNGEKIKAVAKLDGE